MDPEQTPEQEQMAKRAAKGLGLSTQDLAGIASTSVSANDLTKTPTPVVPPTPKQAPEPNTSLASNVGQVLGRDLQSFRDMQAKQQEFAQLMDGETFGNMYQQQLQQFGATPETLRELGEIELQLQKRTEDSNVRQTRIAGAKGQTMAQAGREVTQEQREEAVRSAGLAARAEVLRGNINTAKELATQAVNFAYQDRTLKSTNMINQINWLQNQVDNETKQLLEQEKRKYEEDLATTQTLKQNISAAIIAGASQDEIAALNSSEVPDELKLQLAQQIQARTAQEDRDLSRRSIESQLLTDQAQRANIYDQIEDRQEQRRQALAAAEGTPDEEQQKQITAVDGALDVMTIIKELEGDPALSATVGPISQWLPSLKTVTGDTGTVSRKIDQLKSVLTRGGLESLRGLGPASDRDIMIIEKSVTSLDKGMNETDFATELQKISDASKRLVDKYGVTAEQAAFYYDEPEENLSEADALWSGFDSETTTPMSVTF